MSTIKTLSRRRSVSGEREAGRVTVSLDTRPDERLDRYAIPGSRTVSAEAVAIVGVGVALLAVLVPLILTLHGRVVGEVGDVRRTLTADIADLRRALTADVAEVRRGLHALAERVARIEGTMAALTGPWRAPANGSPEPEPSTEASA